MQMFVQLCDYDKDVIGPRFGPYDLVQIHRDVVRVCRDCDMSDLLHFDPKSNKWVWGGEGGERWATVEIDCERAKP